MDENVSHKYMHNIFMRLDIEMLIKLLVQPLLTS